jgi:hypothetical protein
VIRDYAARLPLFAAERDELETSFLQQAALCTSASLEERRALSCTAFSEAEAATKRWTDRVQAQPSRHIVPLYHQYAWYLHNKQAQFNPK